MGVARLLPDRRDLAAAAFVPRAVLDLVPTVRLKRGAAPIPLKPSEHRVG